MFWKAENWIKMLKGYSKLGSDITGQLVLYKDYSAPHTTVTQDRIFLCSKNRDVFSQISFCYSVFFRLDEIVIYVIGVICT